MNIVLNQIAIWHPCGAGKLAKRLSPIGQVYYEQGNPVAKFAKQPLVRYAKDYEVEKVRFSLFVRTNNDNENLIEKSLDQYAKTLSKGEVLGYLSECQNMDFVYTFATLNQKGELNES